MDKKLVERIEEVVSSKNRSYLGGLEKGDVALLVIPPDQDKEILNGIVDALRDRGVEVDTVYENDIYEIPTEKLMLHTAVDGWKELIYFQDTMRDYLVSRGMVEEPDHNFATGGTLWKALGDYVRKHPKYNKIHVSTHAPGHIRKYLGENKHKFHGHWEYARRELFLSDLMVYPDELISLVDQKTFERVGEASEIRVTDPQGTYFSCPVSEEDAWYWKQTMPIGGPPEYYNPSHLYMLPIQSFRTMNRFEKFRNLVAQVPHCYGVISGTCGHYGYYPHIQVYFEDGFVTRVEGGGRMGDLLREIVERTKDVQFPYISRKGWMYMNGIALGTIPKGFRQSNIFSNTEYLPNAWERLASGVIHWDIGGEHFAQEFLDFCREHKYPEMHCWHVHTYFNTYEMRIRKTGEWVTLIDKGHLTALDDKEVHAVASKYGDPKELLKESWRPKIPGINYPGDYMRDFGRNPAAWVMQEVHNCLPETIGVPPNNGWQMSPK